MILDKGDRGGKTLKVLLIIGCIVAALVGFLFLVIIIQRIIRVFKICLKCACGEHVWDNISEQEQIFRCKICGSVINKDCLPDTGEDSNMVETEIQAEREEKIDKKEVLIKDPFVDGYEIIKRINPEALSRINEINDRMDTLKETIIDLIRELAREREEYREEFQRIWRSINED